MSVNLSQFMERLSAWRAAHGAFRSRPPFADTPIAKRTSQPSAPHAEQDHAIHDALTREQQLNRILLAISGAPDTGHILTSLIEQTVALTGAACGALLIGDARGVAYLRNTVNLPNAGDYSEPIAQQQAAAHWAQQSHMLGSYAQLPSALPALLRAEVDTLLVLLLPLHDETSQLLLLGRTRVGGLFTAHDCALAQTVVAQIGDGLTRARRELVMKRESERRSILFRAGQQIAGSLDIEPLFAIVHQAVAELMLCDALVISLLSDDGLQLRDEYLYDRDGRWQGTAYAADTGLIGYVLRGDRSLLIDDLTPELLRATGAQIFGNAEQMVRSLLLVIMRRGQRRIGVIAVQSHQLASYTADDQAALELLATNAAIAFDHARLYDRERKRVRELEALRDMLADISTMLNPEPLLQALVERVCTLLGADNGVIGRNDVHAQQVHLWSCLKYRDIYEQLPPLPVGQGIYGRAIALRQSVVDNDFQPDERATSLPPELIPRVVMAVPLQIGGEVIGAIGVHNLTDARRFDQHDIDLLQLFAQQAAIAIYNARLYAETQRLATIDGLTGLYNRRHFLTLLGREFKHVLRFHASVSLIMLDIDRFKAINDTHGHLVGDQVIHTLAARCRRNFRDIDVIGRYGGEEFAVLLPETDTTTAVQIAERLRASIAQDPFLTETGPLFVTASLGVASYHVGEELTPEGLIDRADRALYCAKYDGRNCVRLF